MTTAPNGRCEKTDCQRPAVGQVVGKNLCILHGDDFADFTVAMILSSSQAMRPDRCCQGDRVLCEYHEGFREGLEQMLKLFRS